MQLELMATQLDLLGSLRLAPSHKAEADDRMMGALYYETRLYNTRPPP